MWFADLHAKGQLLPSEDDRLRDPETFYQRLGFRPTGEHNGDEAVVERLLAIL